MPTGYFALVLHAHLPFVRHPEDPTVMEEQWLYEAITGTYLPLIQMFEGLPSEKKDPRKSLHVDEIPLPEVGPNEALVAVMATSMRHH